MTGRIIVVSDSTSQGGQVPNGALTRDLDAKDIARVGDSFSCPLSYPGGKRHGVNKIVTGHTSFIVDGIPVAVEGASTECGCILIGSANAYVE
jgi:uncharacterized Zn-binding protein involved in type VI secretion